MPSAPSHTQKNAALSTQPQSTEKQGPYGILFLFGGILLEQRLWSGAVWSRSGRGRRRLWGPGAELSWANVSERPVSPKQIILHRNWPSACPLPSRTVDSSLSRRPRKSSCRPTASRRQSPGPGYHVERGSPGPSARTECAPVVEARNAASSRGRLAILAGSGNWLLQAHMHRILSLNAWLGHSVIAGARIARRGTCRTQSTSY